MLTGHSVRFSLLTTLFVAWAATLAFPRPAYGAPILGPSRPVLRGTIVWPQGMRRAPAFALRDQNAHLITLASLHGHVVAVTFLDSHCRQACPVAGRDLALAQRDLGRHPPLTVVVISVAPKTDTPSSARSFVHTMGIGGRWHWLLGTQSQLQRVWAAWGTYVKPARPDTIHTAAVYLVDQAGYVRVADTVPFRSADLAGSVRALLITRPEK